MHQAEFEFQFPGFYADFGYRGKASLPLDLEKQVLEQFLSCTEQNADNASAIAFEHTQIEGYFVLIVRSPDIRKKFPCSQEEYENSIVPKTAIEFALIQKRYE